MAASSVWRFTAPGGAAEAVPPEEFGTFHGGYAYVVLADGDDAGAQQRLYLWAGAAAPKEVKSTAAMHASELMKSLDASYLRQQQGEEAEEFTQLFSSFTVTEAEEAADADGEAEPGTAPAPIDSEATVAADASPSAEASNGTGTAAATPEASEPAAEEVGAEGSAEEAPEAAGSGDAKAEADAPGAGSAKKKNNKKKNKGHSQQSEADTEAAAPTEPAAQATPEATPASPAPAAQQEASTEVRLAASSEAAPSPAAKEDSQDSAKPSVEEVQGEPVAKAKQLLLERLGGSIADPLAPKQAGKDGSLPNSARTFAAESAKAWGGVVEAAAPPPPVDVKIKPGEQTFGYEELKGMRVESGIDMTAKEAYLSDAEFEKVFGKDRATFKTQPAWRQQMAKKQAGLF